MSACSRNEGFSVIEFAMAIAIAAIIVVGLNRFVSLGLNAKATGRQANELVYQGSFALERMIARARATPPKALSAPTLANSSGNWFSPTMYCLKGGNRLVETTVSDTSCTGANVIANNIVAFSAQLPSGAGPVDDPVGTLAVTVQSGGAPITLSVSVRLGGGTL